MKILTLHCDYIRYQALKKAVKDAEELKDTNLHEIKEPLVVLTSIEQGDNEDTVKQLVEAVEKTASEVKASNIVLYPYAHLSSNLAKPTEALALLKEAETQLKKKFKNVDRAPFGYYKTFEFKCKGHPLAELSKEFKPIGGQATSKKGQSKGEEEVNQTEIEQLVKKLSRVNMQAARGKNDLKSNVEIGKELELYIVNEVVGQGLPIFTQYGAAIKREIERFAVDEEIKRGYLHVSSPVMAKSDLYKVSGHWQHYKDSMFWMKSGDEELALRPMACPFHFILYKSKPRSYKDLPLKYAEIAQYFRNEQSGELRGLTRVRQFALADAHLICRKDQVEQQFEEVLDLLKYSMKKLGINDIYYRFSKWDPKDKKKYIDDPKGWEETQNLMRKILNKLKLKFVEAEGEAAFYGPKLDLQYKDVYGKEDTLLTIQIDFALPERYNLTYTDENGKEVRPMVIHRSSTGATERAMAHILEETQGALPLWLSPRQVRIIAFTDRNNKATEKFAEELREAIPKLRIDTDTRSDTVQSKIRDAEMLKINYIIVIGDKEEENKTIAVRARGEKPKFGIKKEAFISDLKKEMSV